MNTVTPTQRRAPDPTSEPLESVLITEALTRRLPRRPDHAAEVAALHQLAHALGGPQDALLRLLVEQALWLCDAGSSGISLLDRGPEGADTLFRWTALAGALAGNEGGTTPRHFSPCGVCQDQQRAVLFAYPERRFTYFQETLAIPLVEVLVLPFSVREAPAGSIWIVSHRESRRFDLEDVRIMSAIAAFTGAAYALVSRPS